MTTCMFTGHRPQNLPFGYNEKDERCLNLKKYLKELILEKIKNGTTRFLTGMALGVDIYAAEIILSLRKDFPKITLEAIIPCSNQSYKWSEKQIENYNLILKQCNKVIVLQEAYTPDCMFKRNRYMVDQSDCVIAVWDGSSSGTSQTVKYALEKNIPISILHPSTLTVKNL